MRARSPVTLTILAGLLGFTGSAQAGTLASGFLVDGLTPALEVACDLSNIGTRAVTVLSARILTSAGGEATNFQGCTGSPLAAGATCGFGASGTAGGRGLLVVRGGTTTLRGTCSLYGPGGLLGTTEMR